MAALGTIRHAAIPPLLAALFGDAADKTRRKALKRALYLLKTRGVPVPAALLPREEPVIGKEQTPAVQASVSPILGNGDCCVVLEGPKEILGGNVLATWLNDVTGLRECHLLNLKSKQLAEFWEHYRQQGLTLFPVPGAYAVRLLETAYGQPGADSVSKRTYGALRDKIWKNWGRPESAPDPEQTLPAIDPADRGRLLEQSRQLATRPLFHTWLPGVEEITPWVEKIQEIERSPLVLSEAQKQARGDALVDEATRALYPPETRPLWRRRLLAMAYYLDQSQQPEEARIARVAAADLADTGPSHLAGENPFLKSLVQMALRLAWEESRQPQETHEPGSLLSLPGDSPLLRR
jgi:hypothetical protein